MGRIITYIATSLDGFIARKDNDVSWLDPYNDKSVEYRYTEFMKQIGTAIMGARTYEQSLLHPERLLPGVKNYVITRRSLRKASGVDIEFWHESLRDLASEFRDDSKRDAYLVGGGNLVSQFLEQGLIDEIRQFVVPIILSDGIPLYTGIGKEITLCLTGAETFPNGIVQLTYHPAQPSAG